MSTAAVIDLFAWMPPTTQAAVAEPPDLIIRNADGGIAFLRH